MRVERRSVDPDRPYANLLPLVEELVRLGNVPLDGGFILTQAGWQCRFRQPCRSPELVCDLAGKRTVRHHRVGYPGVGPDLHA